MAANICASTRTLGYLVLGLLLVASVNGHPQGPYSHLDLDLDITQHQPSSRSENFNQTKSGSRCGTVPIYEKIFQKSINVTSFGNPGTEAEGDFRILHGLDATPGEWPWIVKIKQCEGENCGACTGTLLNSRWVITAGHCCFNKTVDNYTATFGLYDLITPDATVTTAKFDKMVLHSEYKNLNNDLALLRLQEPIAFSDFIQPACMLGPIRNVLDYAKDRRCFTVGYGLVENMVQGLKLQKLEVVARQPSECNSDQLNNIQMRPNTVCMGPVSGKIGSSCRGDSGGPNLCYEAKGNRWTIFSTVSYGPADCDRDENDKWLTVSVDLSNFRGWILSVISDMG